MIPTLLLLASAGALLAADIPLDGIDLPNGTKIRIDNGNVSVEATNHAAGPNANGSASSSVSVRTEGRNKIATVISERDGRRETRTVIIGPDGKATVSGPVNEPPAGEQASPNRAWLGVNCAEIPAALRAQIDVANGEGVLVEHLAPEGPAASAGLMQNDIILALDKRPVGSVQGLRNELSTRIPGAQITVDYLRKGRRASVHLTLAERGGTQPSGIGTAMEKLQRDQPGANTQRRTVVIASDGKPKIVEGGSDDAFDALLNDPNVPPTFKETVRKQREEMRKFMEKHGNNVK